MENILDTILKDAFTQTLLRHRLRILNQYLIKTFFGGGAVETLAPADLNWLKSLPNSFYQQFSKDNIYKQFAALEDQIQKLLPLIIYLPFAADDEALSNIGSFVRKTFASSSLILDIKFDPNLIAGCALSFKGVYRDYSLRARIEEKKGEVLESFKKFLR